MYWTDAVDEILEGDQALALAYITPARGVVIVPVTNFGMRDRDAGTVAVNSSVGAWKKLDRIARNPNVALAFHARDHGSSGRDEYVLVQGRATLSEPIPDYPATVSDHWERYEAWRDLHPLWKLWLRIFALRVEIRVTAERVISWPDLACRGEPELRGAPWPGDPPAPQRPPARGTAARIDAARAARRARRLPHVLLGWVGADGFPVVVPVGVGEATRHGIRLEPPAHTVPPGGRRAGLTAHWFAPRVVGQHQRVHTGWLEASDAVLYAPHTIAAYRFPASTALFRLVAGAGTRWRARQA
ncbi:MAG TPA: pyridoxamine 5'-phosphate oxidase family protein [Solirubrobacteraceae bacterium]